MQLKQLIFFKKDTLFIISALDIERKWTEKRSITQFPLSQTFIITPPFEGGSSLFIFEINNNHHH